jgi:hypothetical protein
MEYRMAMFETAMEPLRQYCEDRANARGDRFHVHELNAVAAEWAAIPANKESVASILVAAALVMIQQNKLNATAEGLTNG